MDDETRDQIKKLEADLYTIETELGKLYRRRDPVLEQLAQLRGPVVLPKRRHQTDRQSLVSRCPRCSGVIE